MAIFKVLSKKNIYKKLPVINAKRAFYVSLFFVICLPLLAILALVMSGTALFSDHIFKYMIYLFIISLAYIGALYFADGMGYTSMFRPLYRSYYLLSSLILLCISHILFARTGSLYVYIIATLYVAIIPVFCISELKYALILTLIAILTFVIPYDLTGFQLFQIAFTNILFVPVTLWKYYTTINSLMAKAHYPSRQSSFS